jgi:hypothetical protein
MWKKVLRAFSAADVLGRLLPHFAANAQTVLLYGNRGAGRRFSRIISRSRCVGE